MSKEKEVEAVEETTEVVEESKAEKKGKGKECEACHGTGLASESQLCPECEGHGRA